MKAIILGCAALCAQLGTVYAAPKIVHGAGTYTTAHDHYDRLTTSGARDLRHPHFGKRQVSTSIVTQVEHVTVTDYDATVVVDKAGMVIRTDFKAVPTPDPSFVATTSTDSQPTIAVVSSATPAPPVSPVDASPSPVVQVSSQTSLSSRDASPTPNAAKAVNNGGVGLLKGFSIDYDPVTGTPGNTKCRDFSADFAFLKGQGVGNIRVYDIGCPLDQAVTAANANGIKLILGLNTITNLADDLDKLITMVKNSPAGFGPVDTINIGNELVQGGTAASAVAGAVSTAKGILSAAGYNGNVVTIDTISSFLDPTTCSTSSYCAVNAHAYFDPNSSADTAGSFVRNAVNQVGAKNAGKRVVVTESGWPYAGPAIGKAIPSADNQRTAMAKIMAEFASSPADVYLFQDFDATYKNVAANSAETYFGLFDTDHFTGAL